jgi:hypothetical protein
MRSNRVARLAVAVGLALLGAASAGVSGITAPTAATVPATIGHHHGPDGDHDGPGDGRKV